jgi:hypothetical protein
MPSLAEMIAGAAQTGMLSPASPRPILPPQLYGLPEAVQRSIMTQPSYGEGQVMAPEQWWSPAEGGQLQQLGPQREERLQFDRREALGIPNPDTPNPWASLAIPEGGVWSSRPPGVSPFASPLNQPQQRPAFGLY